MHLTLALLESVGPRSCDIRWLDGGALGRAQIAPAMHDQRIKLQPRQLVAVDTAAAPAQIVWRWLRGRVDYQVDGFVVVNNQLYQPGCRVPISVARVPDELGLSPAIGDEVFYTLGPDGVVVDVAADGLPLHAQRLGADLFPAIEEIYADLQPEEA
ncbi:MAG TPA: hypothetical protein VD886_08930 [Herpetosiphonaceae bacterium]|nr:hypothetical protein [Herpetosiphonaceae bacterium]